MKLRKPSARWGIGVLAVVMLGLLGWALIVFFEPVPTWRGTSIHSWLAELNNDHEAELAIIELDTAALPTLRRYASARDTAISRTKVKHWSKLPVFLQTRLTPPVSAATLRGRAANAYRFLAATAAVDAPILIRLLDDADPQVCMTAAMALGQIGVKDSAVVAALVAHAGNTNLNLRSSCISSLGILRARTPAAYGVLTNALRDLDASIRAQAAGALYLIHAQDAGVIEALIQDVRRDHFLNCSSQILALAEAGPAASNAAPVLLKVLESVYSTNQSHDTICCYTVWALGAIGPSSSAAVPKLRELRNDPRAWMRVDAAVALWRITGRAEEALPTLTQSNNSHIISERSFEPLGRMGTNALPALPFVIPYLTNRIASLPIEAATTAWQIAPDQFPSPLPALTNALLATTNDYPKYPPRALVDLRMLAAFRLGKLGASAQAAVPALRAARKSPDWGLRQAIDRALDDIEIDQP